ncbi:MAG TPA: histidine phosphatase family protein [Pyrinomonadaceae bacterium]|nr:histidine phosphatase family protein [Pyrinomonadaceae bacterium]
MRKIFLSGLSFLIAGTLIIASGWHSAVYSQKKKTIILVRHAEKLIPSDEDNRDDPAVNKDDPPLSQAGQQRAANLAKILKKYKIGEVYSTNYSRTRETAEPTANSRRLKINFYDAKQNEKLISKIFNSKRKRFLIVGHSNTIPGLVNLW